MSAPRWRPPERPKLRGDLQCKKSTQGTTLLYKIKTPESQSVCLLHDVEFTVLKLMDGKRDLADIVQQSTKTGLAMNQVQLEKFIRELVAYKFVENAEPLPPWSPQSFVDPPEEAVEEPKSGEELFRSLAARVQEGPDEPGGWDALRATAQRTFERGGNWAWLKFQELQLKVKPLWRRAKKAVQPLWRKVKGRRAVLIGAAAAGVLLVAVGVLALVRLPVRVSYPGQLSVVQAVDVPVPYETVVAEISAKDGQRVKRGDVLARLDADALKVELSNLQTALEKGQQELAVMRKGTDPNEVDEERRRLKEAQRQLAAQKKAKSSARAELEQQIAHSRRRLALLASASEQGAIVRKEIDTDTIRKNRLRAQDALAQPEVRAPISGTIEHALPSGRAGAVVRLKEPIARITAGDAFLGEAKVPESEVEAVSSGAPVRFTPDSQPKASFEGHVLEVGKSQGGEARVTLELKDHDGQLAPGVKGTATIEVGRHSVLAALFGR